MSRFSRSENAFLLPVILGVGGLALFGSFLWRFVSVGGLSTNLFDQAQRCLTSFAGVTKFLHYGHYLLLIVSALSISIFFLSLFRQTKKTSSLLASLALQPIGLFRARLAAATDQIGLSLERIKIVDSQQYLCFTAGLFKPDLYLSTGAIQLLDDNELLAVLNHEKTHLQKLDPLKSLLLRSLKQSFFFLPLMKILEERYLLSKEISADSAAATFPRGRLGLAQAMYKLSVQSPKTSSILNYFAAGRDLEIRLSFIAGKEIALAYPSLFRIVLNGLLMSSILFLVATPPKAEAKENDCARLKPALNANQSVIQSDNHFQYQINNTDDLLRYEHY